MPCRTQDKRIDGVVITFVDISAAKALEATLRAVLGVLQFRLGERGAPVDTVGSPEGVLDTVQTVLTKGLTGQTVEADRSRANTQAKKGGKP